MIANEELQKIIDDCFELPFSKTRLHEGCNYRYGNKIVYVSNTESNGKRVWFKDSDLQEFDGYVADVLDPVRISREEMEKLGFTEAARTDVSIIYKHESIGLAHLADNKNGKEVLIHSYRFKYVHELQLLMMSQGVYKSLFDWEK